MATKLQKKPVNADGSMSLMGHIKEFRNRLIICALVFFVGVAVSLAFADKIVTLLANMGIPYGYQFITTAPQEKLMQYFKLSILAAIIITIPVALYHIWAFAKPGLKKGESLFFGLAMLFGLLLFCGGVAFAYCISLPFMLNFLITLEGTDFVVATTSLDTYIDFVITIFVVFGSVFEMPLLTVILSKMGIANPTVMRKGRGLAIVLIFVVAAIITPPDIVSQAMVGFPMILLYEISILLSQLTYRKKVESDDEDEDDEEEDEEEA